MRGALLGTVTLIVIAGLWSSVELYVGLVLPAQQRAANGEAAQAVGDSSSDATRAGGRRARCAELLVAGGCDGPASAVPDECAPLCRAITASDSPPNATGAAAPDRGGVRARGAHPAAEARAKVGAALLPGVPGVRRSSFGFSGAQPANAQPSTPAKRLVAPSDGFGNPIGTDCGALVAAGACFVDMRYMLLESPCAALCARYRGLPPEARQWVAPRSCYGRHAPALAAAGPGPTLDTNGYFQLVGGREQMNKNRFLVIDALFYAKALNRTFVEPAMRNSRIVRPPRPASATPPAERARAWAAERVAAFVRAGIRPPRDDAPANYTLGFGTYWEMKPVCHLHRTIDVLTFEQLSVRARARRRACDMAAGSLRARTWPARRLRFPRAPRPSSMCASVERSAPRTVRTPTVRTPRLRRRCPGGPACGRLLTAYAPSSCCPARATSRGSAQCAWQRPRTCAAPSARSRRTR